MWNNKQRQAIFGLLKNALKAKKKTYKELANHIGTSELTVKRLFRDQDCKVSRLMAICDFVDLDLEDLLTMQQRQNHYPEYLPEATEKALADDTTAFGIFLLVISNLTTADIARISGFSETKLYLVLRQLEALNLIALNSDNQFTISVNLPIAWRLHGHLAKALKAINQRYLAYCFDNEHQPEHTYTSNGRLMKPASAALIRQKIDELRTYFHHLATQDQLFYAAEKLSIYKLQIAHSPFPVREVIFSNKLIE